MLTRAFQLCLLLCLRLERSAGERRAKKTLKYATELTFTNVTTNLEDWDSDLAIMFHAPWCKYCKQLAPSFDQIAALNSNTKDLVVGKFDCEVPATHADVCKLMGIDRYPSVYFIGYGSLHQGPDGALMGRSVSAFPRVAKYSADMYPEAILDWITMLTGISRLQRSWSDVTGVLTGESRMGRKVQRLRRSMLKTDARIAQLEEEVAGFEAVKIFDSLTDQGDPFAVINEPPTEANYVMRVCVVEMAAEYCKHFASEAYCSLVPECNKKDMVPVGCRPATCPFKDKRGCVVTSQCMVQSVLDNYRQALGVK